MKVTRKTRKLLKRIRTIPTHYRDIIHDKTPKRFLKYRKRFYDIYYSNRARRYEIRKKAKEERIKEKDSLLIEEANKEWLFILNKEEKDFKRLYTLFVEDGWEAAGGIAMAEKTTYRRYGKEVFDPYKTELVFYAQLFKKEANRLDKIKESE